MSWWTHIRGFIQVDVPGRTQAEIDYILQTILDHMPRVTGSEGDMVIHKVKADDHNSSSSDDEFQCRTNNLVDWYGNKSQKNGWLNTQSRYFLLLEGNLRDRFFDQTLKEFMKFLCRLSKRIHIEDIMVKLYSYDQSILLTDYKQFDNMYEWPSWCDESDGEPAWWEYLMWDRFEDWPLPIQHVVKYYECKEADKAWEAKFKDD